MKNTIFIFFGILISLKTIALQDYNLQFDQISTKNGLSQNTVRTILEDKKGFIWAGTLDGLNRYDGYNLVSYKPNLGHLNSLIDHRIKEIYQDKDGYMWVKTFGNEFSCYDPISDSFSNYYDLNIAKDNTVFSDYYEATNGDIWLWGHSNSIVRIHKDQKKFTTTTFLKGKVTKNKNYSRFLFEDSRSCIWAGGQLGLLKIDENQVEQIYNGKYSFTKAVELNNKIYFMTENSMIIEYDIKRKTFSEIKNADPKEIFLDAAQLNNNELLIVSRNSGVITFNINTHIFEKPRWAEDSQLKGDIKSIVDKNLGIWLFNHSGIIWYYNQKNQDVKKLELIPSDITKIIDLERYSVYIDSKNLIWITTYGNGLFLYDVENDKLTNYKHNTIQNSPASDYLLAITEDKQGNIWIGSEYAGIIKVARSDYDIKTIYPEPETSIGKNNNIRAVYEDRYSNVWIGTKNGRLYKYDNTLTKGECIYKDINPCALAEDTKNRLWIGTKTDGFYIMEQNPMKEIAHYKKESSNNKGLGANSIFCILKDSKDRMWLGSFERGISLAEETANGFIFHRFFEDEGSLSFVRCLYQDTKGFFWAGTNGGIIRFNPDELIKNPKAYVTYQMNLNDKNGLNCSDVKTIYEDEDGVIWIGTGGGGLSKFIETADNKSGYFIAYTVKNGLSSDFVCGIMEDKEHNLWISTENGITKFYKKTNSFVVYQISEDIYDNNFNENAVVYSSDGNMLWGSLNGLLVINPESFTTEVNTFPVILTNIFLHDQIVQAGEKDSPLKQSISYSKEIKLNYKQNTFTIGFSSLNLKEPSQNKYVYMLKNYDEQWSLVSHLNSATYKNLPPGNYVFMVKGANSDGVWNDDVTELKIHISPPFWESWYAYIVYIILILIATYIIFKLVFKFNTLNNNIKLEKELTNHKLRFFTNISHEFRTPLTIMQGVIENLNSPAITPEIVKKQVSVLNRNSTILTRLIEQLLEFRKLQNNVLTLDLEETDIIDFSKDIYTGFEEMAVQKNIEYSFVCDRDSYKMYIDRRKVDKILYNLLSNAFKFTPKEGKVELQISFNEENETCKIIVKDNGIGIDRNKQHLLFSRFMQINFSSTGTGVGLSLVKEFVDAHKGKIWYEDNGSQGSIFNIELSTNKEVYKGENFIVSTHSDILPNESKNNTIRSRNDFEYDQIIDIDDSTLSEYKMLIIDDNDDIRNFLVDEFGKYFMVEEAENGKIGLQKAIDINPDLIICDVMMPEMDGFEVTRRLKEDFETCHIPIILLTAHSSIEHQIEGVQSGADAYIIKPFSLSYLKTRVFKLVEQREQLKKRFSKEYVLDGNLIVSTDRDKEFYNKVDRIMEENLGDVMFSVDKFAELVNMRRTLFYKKLKGVTGLPPNDFIKIRRLKRAAELLLQGELTVSQISYEVGFSTPYYFSKCFKEEYNCPPSRYGRINIKEDQDD